MNIDLLNNSNYPYLHLIRIPHTLLFLYLILAANFAYAKQFIEDKDKKDYKVMEVNLDNFL